MLWFTSGEFAGFHLRALKYAHVKESTVRGDYIFWFGFQEELMESSSDAESSSEEEKSHGSVIDMEDLGNVMNHMKKAKVKNKSSFTLLTCSLLSFRTGSLGF